MRSCYASNWWKPHTVMTVGVITLILHPTRNTIAWQALRSRTALWTTRSNGGAIETVNLTETSAKLQNTLPLICISLNKNSDYCYIPRSSKHTDTCKMKRSWSGRVFCSYSETSVELDSSVLCGTHVVYSNHATRICIIASKRSFIQSYWPLRRP